MNEYINYWLWKWSLSLHRGPVGGPLRGGCFTRDLKGRWHFALSGNPVYCGLRKICKRRFWKQAALSIGASLGNLKGVHFTRNYKRQMESPGDRMSLSIGALWEESEGKVPLLSLPCFHHHSCPIVCLLFTTVYCKCLAVLLLLVWWHGITVLGIADSMLQAWKLQMDYVGNTMAMFSLLVNSKLSTQI
jgi:hypothetical protein